MIGKDNIPNTVRDSIQIPLMDFTLVPLRKALRNAIAVDSIKSPKPVLHNLMLILKVSVAINSQYMLNN